jgi:hypothetical protein
MQNLLVISDIHLYMYRRTKLLKSCCSGAFNSIDDIHNTYTLSYIDSAIENALSKSKNTKIIFLGDIADNAYLKEKEIQQFNTLLYKYNNIEKIIILGNHDTSSSIPKNKIIHSSLRFLININNIELITSYKIEIQDNTALIYWSFTQRKDMYDTLRTIFKTLKYNISEHNIKDIIMMTHNNIYLTDTLMGQQMFPLYIITKMLDEAHINKDINFTLVNGHIHTTHYEKKIY